MSERGVDMTWACANGHRVQDGMFVCPACGSGDVWERGGVSPRAALATAPLDEDAPPAGPTATLRALTWMGIGFTLVGGSSAVDILREGASEQSVTALLSGFTALVGWGLLLVAIIGWGVKLGIEAARDGAAADVPERSPTAS